MNRAHVTSIAAIHDGCCGPDPIGFGPGTGDANWFDPAAYLGKRGWKYTSEPVRYVLSAAGMLPATDGDGSENGIFIGTGSADLEHRRSLASELQSPECILPGAASAPNASVNMPAGALAKKLGAKGPVFTMTGGDEAPLVSLWVALAALARGEIRHCVVGQVEHDASQPAHGGAVLWQLGPSDTGLGVEIAAGTWSRDLGDIAELTGPVTLIAGDGPMRDGAIAVMSANNIEFTEFADPGVSETVLDGMVLFSLLSLTVTRRIGGSILVLSGNGQFFTIHQQPKGNPNV